MIIIIIDGTKARRLRAELTDGGHPSPSLPLSLSPPLSLPLEASLVHSKRERSFQRGIGSSSPSSFAPFFPLPVLPSDVHQTVPHRSPSSDTANCPFASALLPARPFYLPKSKRKRRMPNWELKNCCDRDQTAFIVTIGVFTFVILLLWRTFLLRPFKLITVFLHETSHALACKLTCGDVEGIQVHADEGGVTQTRGGIYWIILPAGYLGSSFWGMVFILASTNLLATRIAAGCFLLALVIVLFYAENWLLRGLCIGFIIFVAIVWLLQEATKVHVLRYVILFIGVMNSLFSVYDIYDDLISRRINSSDAEKFAEICPCPCNGVAWGVIWGLISFTFLCGSIYLGLVILS